MDMRILQINCVYPSGATGKITAAVHHRLLSEGHTSQVLYSRGKRREEPHAFRVSGVWAGKTNHLISMLTGDVYGGCGLQTRRILRHIRRYQPDVVHLQCINGYFVNIYRLLDFLKRQGIPTVLTLHADFMFTANCGSALGCDKWQSGCGNCPELRRATNSLFFDRTASSFKKMQKAMEGFGDKLTVVGVSDWISQRAAKSPIMKDIKIVTVANGIDTSVFVPVSSQALENPSGAEKTVLWVTSHFADGKGRHDFLKLAESMRNEPYRFVVVGENPPRCELKNVTFMGKVHDVRELASLYAAADVALCCSAQESFSLVCAEAQCCGTPVVAFDAGGVSETVRDGIGEVVPLGDISAMADAVKRQSQKKREISQEKLAVLHDRFDQTRMAEAYLSLYRELLMKQEQS